MEEVEKHGDAPEDFKLYALNGGEALTNMAPWKNMLANHIDPAAARAWAEQGHVRFIDARKSPELLEDVAALHAVDARPLVIDTARSSNEVERAIYPTQGTRYYLRGISTAPAAWVIGSVGAAGHATSPLLLYLLLNLIGLALIVWSTARLQDHPARQLAARVTIAALFILGLLFAGNSFYEFRAAVVEDFMLYFFKVRLTAVFMMGVALWLMSSKLSQWLSRPARLLVLMPIIWGISKVTFLAMPPHAYASYAWLLTLTAFVAVAAMSPELLAGIRRSKMNTGVPPAGGAVISGT